MKLLILVQACDDAPYRELNEAQRNTWDSVNVPNVFTYYYLGNSTHNGLYGVDVKRKKIYCPCSEAYEMMHWRMKQTLDYIWDMEWDFIFRTNSSTFVRKEKVYEFIKNNQHLKYAGEATEGMVSGTGIIMSREIVKILIDQLDETPTHSEDGVMGSILGRNGIKPEQAMTRPQFNFVEDRIVEAEYYRCKSEILKSGATPAMSEADRLDRSYDIIAFNKLMKHHYGI